MSYTILDDWLCDQADILCDGPMSGQLLVLCDGLGGYVNGAAIVPDAVSATASISQPRTVAKILTHVSHNIERPPVPPRARF
jgi:hypothetical protein